MKHVSKRLFPKQPSREEIFAQTKDVLREKGVDNIVQARFCANVASLVIGNRNPLFSSIQPKMRNQMNPEWKKAFDLVISFLNKNGQKSTLEVIKTEMQNQVISSGNIKENMLDSIVSRQKKAPIQQFSTKVKKCIGTNSLNDQMESKAIKEPVKINVTPNSIKSPLPKAKEPSPRIDKSKPISVPFVTLPESKKEIESIVEDENSISGDESDNNLQLTDAFAKKPIHTISTQKKINKGSFLTSLNTPPSSNPRSPESKNAPTLPVIEEETRLPLESMKNVNGIIKNTKNSNNSFSSDVIMFNESSSPVIKKRGTSHNQESINESFEYSDDIKEQKSSFISETQQQKTNTNKPIQEDESTFMDSFLSDHSVDDKPHNVSDEALEIIDEKSSIILEENANDQSDLEEIIEEISEPVSDNAPAPSNNKWDSVPFDNDNIEDIGFLSLSDS